MGESAGAGSDFEQEGGNGVEDPFAQLGHHLWNKGKIDLSTNIPKPNTMTLIDLFAEWCDEEFGPEIGKFVKSKQKWYRTNMIAYKGWRADKTADMVKGANAEEARAQKEMKKVLEGAMR